MIKYSNFNSIFSEWNSTFFLSWVTSLESKLNLWRLWGARVCWEWENAKQSFIHDGKKVVELVN